MKEESLREIKEIFRRYRQNKQQLAGLCAPELQAVAYDKIAVKTDKSVNAQEERMLAYLQKKQRLEKEIALVDRLYDYYADERNEELAKLIDLRFRQGKYHWQAVSVLYVSDRQGFRLLDEAYKKAVSIAVQLHVLKDTKLT